MNVLITARKFKARASLKDYITGEVESLKKYNSDILTAEVVLSFQNSKDSIKLQRLLFTYRDRLYLLKKNRMSLKNQ